MTLRELILTFLLQFAAGISAEPTYLYHRLGDHVVLPCENAASSGYPECPETTWLFNRNADKTVTLVRNGHFDNTALEDRMTLSSGCSLTIDDITADDAGFYACKRISYTDEGKVYLNILTISPSPTGADPNQDHDVTLTCSLFKYNEIPCEPNSLHWLDEAGNKLQGEAVDYKLLTQTNCQSVLLVKRQSGHNRKYRCQLNDGEEIHVDYTTGFSGLDQGAGDAPSYRTLISVGAAVGVGVVVLLILTAVLIKCRKRAKDVQKAAYSFKVSHHNVEVPEPQADPDDNLTYINVSHVKNKSAPKTNVQEGDEVTYATVKITSKGDRTRQTTN